MTGMCSIQEPTIYMYNIVSILLSKERNGHQKIWTFSFRNNTKLIGKQGGMRAPSLSNSTGKSWHPVLPISVNQSGVLNTYIRGSDHKQGLLLDE